MVASEAQVWSSLALDGPVDVANKQVGRPEADGPKHEQEGIAHQGVVAKEERGLQGSQVRGQGHKRPNSECAGVDGCQGG